MTEAALVPNTDTMAEFLEHAFGGYLDGLQNGLIEIACCANQGSQVEAPAMGCENWWSHLFGTDEIDEAVAYATGQNARGHNLYFAPALRHPDSPRNKRGKKANVIGTVLLWTEWDDGPHFDLAKEKMKFAKPTAGLITGRVPDKRAQAFWRLQTAITDIDEIDGALNGLCVALAGDPKVVHADCLMRLPGSVSWRKLNKPERIDEMTKLEIGKAGMPVSYPAEQILKVYPSIVRQGTGESYDSPPVRGTGPLGLGGSIEDGRETYMRATILACLIEFVGLNGAAPTAEDLFAAAWPQYAANVSFHRPGRGESEFRVKCRYTAARFLTGRIPRLPDLEAALAAYTKKKPAAAATEPRIDDSGSLPFCAADLRGKAPPREWIIPDWLPAKTTSSLYGNGGIGKTLLAQQLATAHAIGGQWCGLDIPKGTVLGVFCEDDYNEVWRRQDDIDEAMGTTFRHTQLKDLHYWDRVGFDNIMQNFNREGVGSLQPFFEILSKQVKRLMPTLMILDTAADVFGGNEVVRAQVNQFVKSTLGSFPRRFGTTVLILAHPSKSGMAEGGDGTSGSTAWNNAVRARWYLEGVEGGLSHQRVLTRMKSNYSASGDDHKIELVWEKGVLTTKPAPDTVDRIGMNALKHRVEIAVKQCWDAGAPIGARNSSRPWREVLPRMIKDFPVAQIARAFVDLEADGVISKGHGDSHKRGYKVVRSNFITQDE